MSLIADIAAIAAGQPVLLALMLFAATFVVEDAATIAAGILAAHGGIDVTTALIAVIAGTAAGDMALYAVGRWGAGTRWAMRGRQQAQTARVVAYVSARALPIAIAARFVPGSRLPVFTACGIIRAPALPFAAIIAVTTPLWTGFLFEAARRTGEAGAVSLTSAVLPAGLLLAAIILLPGLIRRVTGLQ